MKWTSIALACCVGFTACSADSDGSSRGAGVTGGSGAAGVAGTAASGGLGGSAASGAGAGGASGGLALADAAVGGEQALPAPIAIDECGSANAAGLPPDDISTLQAGGSSAGLRYSYPYDGTVFPRGLIAPLLMWQGADTATAVYVHMQSSLFEYDGCLTPTGPGQLQLPQHVWEEAGARALGPNDPFSVELTVLDGGAAKGPIQEQIIIARATLKGSIYYNSYESKLAPNPGAVLRIVPGRDAELFAGGDHCTGCHAVSADGSRLVVSGGEVYAMTPTTAPQPPPLRTDAEYSSFVGLSPDGKLYAANAQTNGFGPRSDDGTNPTATLYETDTGTALADTGLPAGASMITFSGDGKRLAFNDYALDDGHGIAMMDFDPASRKASQYRALWTSTGDKFPGWPFSLPDDKAVVFSLTTNTNFSGGNVGIEPIAGVPPGPWTTYLSPDKGPHSNIYVVSEAGGQPVMLARAMGYANERDAATGTSYLGHGAEELDQNYYPTVSPVAAGGYFWVFFDSYRHYGNLGLHRQLWGAAISVSATGEYTNDPSHPAFYLTGQEYGTGNHRAFAALDACRADGATCETGIACCGGFCTEGVCEQPNRCAHTDEACETSADCCDASNVCIGGFCGIVIVE